MSPRLKSANTTMATFQTTTAGSHTVRAWCVGVSHARRVLDRICPMPVITGETNSPATADFDPLGLNVDLYHPRDASAHCFRVSQHIVGPEEQCFMWFPRTIFDPQA